VLEELRSLVQFHLRHVNSMDNWFEPYSELRAVRGEVSKRTPAIEKSLSNENTEAMLLTNTKHWQQSLCSCCIA